MGRHHTRSSRLRRSLLALGAVVAAAAVVAAVAVYAGTRDADDGPADAEPTPRVADEHELRASFDRLSLPVPAGLAIAGVGRAGTMTFGDQTPQDAWSIIKAPLGLAAERKHGMSRTEMDAVVDSDNRSARVLTRSLGSPDDATRALHDVLREGGDTTTVPAPRHGDDYPMLGETRWSLADSATWTAHLPCMTGSEHLLELMRAVAPVQDWGVRVLHTTQTAAKGGWGPAADGGYVVRQIGLVTRADGAAFAVSMSAHAPRMTFETGTRTLDRIGHWLADRLATLPAGHCPIPHA